MRASSSSARAGGKSSSPAARRQRRRGRQRCPSSKPRRPLTAFALFFRQERSNMLEGTSSSLASSLGSGDKLIHRQGGLQGGLPQQQVGAVPARSLSPNAIHRAVSAKWRDLDASSRVIYDGLAQLERRKYERELRAWNARAVEERKAANDSEDGKGDSSSSSDEDQDFERESRSGGVSPPLLPSFPSSDAFNLSSASAAAGSFAAAAAAAASPALAAASAATPLPSSWSPSPSAPATASASSSLLRPPPLNSLQRSISERKRQLQIDADREYFSRKQMRGATTPPSREAVAATPVTWGYPRTALSAGSPSAFTVPEKPSQPRPQPQPLQPHPLLHRPEHPLRHPAEFSSLPSSPAIEEPLRGGVASTRDDDAFEAMSAADLETTMNEPAMEQPPCGGVASTRGVDDFETAADLETTFDLDPTTATTAATMATTTTATITTATRTQSDEEIDSGIWSEEDVAMLAGGELPCHRDDDENDNSDSESSFRDSLERLVEAWEADEGSNGDGDGDARNAAIDGCGNEDERDADDRNSDGGSSDDNDDEDDDDERMQLHLYDPTPVAFQTLSARLLREDDFRERRTADAGTVGREERKEQDLMIIGGWSSPTPTVGSRAARAHFSAVRATAGGGGGTSSPLDGESVRFLASIFCARTA